jgi:hypothetical protein
MLDYVSLSPETSRHKLSADAIESACNLRATRRNLRYSRKEVSPKVESIIPLLKRSDDTNGDAPVCPMPREIRDPLTALNVADHISERPTDETLSPVVDVDDLSIWDRHSLKPTRLVGNIADLDPPQRECSQLRH